ncbi:MAG: dihydrolipoyl dehydrogenase [Deltaproteobacteria bacterium]|nr:dihydrolipoyl dehydrogenase [Deltaproteobacteria bacterium]
MSTKVYDAIVLGGGPGGYVAAIRLGQLKQKTLVIEKDTMGGVCLNWGCIPSKALIAAANLVEKVKHADVMGITVTGVAVDSKKLQGWKNGIVKKLTGGVNTLCKANGAEVLMGEARFVSSDTLEVTTPEGKVLVQATKGIIVATGSRPVAIPGFEYDGKSIITAKEGVSLDPLPKRLTIIGGGIIGMELGGVYSKLGVEVTIVEFMPSVLATMDADLVVPVVKAMTKSGVKFITGTKAKSAVKQADGSLLVTLETPEGEQKVAADVCLVAVGMKPNSDAISIEKSGVILDKRGHLVIDEECRTNVKKVYAIGDVAGAPYLAHKASKEGEIAAEVIAGHKSARDWRAMPAATFTHPEIANVGLSEREAREKGLDIVVGKFPFAASGRAMAVSETDGFVKVIAERVGKDKKDHKIIGVHIVGPEASDLISEAALALEMDAYVEDMALTVHPHPTLSETMMEAAKHAIGEAVHIMNR